MSKVARPERFLSTPSARRATGTDRRDLRLLLISIHALREEGDRYADGHYAINQDFYPRPPRGGRPRSLAKPSRSLYFYPRPPRGGRPRRRRPACRHTPISIHALREEGDPHSTPPSTTCSDFYPRPPRGGRRDTLNNEEAKGYFYPRPPRGGRQDGHGGDDLLHDFYPRPPRGGRLVWYR